MVSSLLSAGAGLALNSGHGRCQTAAACIVLGVSAVAHQAPVSALPTRPPATHRAQLPVQVAPLLGILVLCHPQSSAARRFFTKMVQAADAVGIPVRQGSSWPGTVATCCTPLDVL